MNGTYREEGKNDTHPRSLCSIPQAPSTQVVGSGDPVAEVFLLDLVGEARNAGVLLEPDVAQLICHTKNTLARLERQAEVRGWVAVLKVGCSLPPHLVMT